MSIAIECVCGQRLRASETQAGKTLSCPKCGGPIVVPHHVDANDVPPPPPANPLNVALPRPGDVEMETPQPKPSRIPLYLSSLALVISLAVAASHIFTDPLGAGISTYDFTTPQKALDSSLAIQQSLNIRASLELAKLKVGRINEEKKETVKVHRDAEYQGKKILFISFKENGITKYDTAAFEKDAESGFWFQSYVSQYDMSDSALKAAIVKWTNKTDADTE